jgi:beta-glucanase (GH16 family)
VRDAKGNWTSGRIETQRSNFAAPVGGKLAVEASIQVPNVTGAAAQGYWPAFWMLGSAFRGNYNNWPKIGEIDAMENVNGDDVEHGTLHCGVVPGGPCNEKLGRGGTANCAKTTCQAGFHTYRIEVDRSTSPEEIRWYLDGVEFWHVASNAPGMDANTWANAVDHSFFIILNVAIGGDWPGSPTAATKSNAPMLVDYVHVYTFSGSPTTTPTPTTASTPTPTPTKASTPTPTPSSGCTAGNFTEGVTSTGSSSAQVEFTPCSWTAGYVILHYTTPGSTHQNAQTTYNATTKRWEYSISGISSKQTLQYSFTYQKGGLQYDTGSYTWTHP